MATPTPDIGALHTAERIAIGLIGEVRAAGWQVGSRLGSETELMARYGVGRNVLREAIRLLANQGVVRVQPGRGGGLVVAEPAAHPFSRALELYLAARGVSGEHVLEAKREVELTCVRLATRRRTPESIERLSRAVAEEGATPIAQARNIRPVNVHIVLAEMTGNPALHLFIEALTHLSADYVDPDEAIEAARDTYAAHGRIAAAVSDGDEASAVAEMAAHLDVVDAAVRRHPTLPIG